jgi:REP element-mobilizing transposase RayT
MTFQPQKDESHLYFATASLLGWRPLFMRPEFAWIVLNALDWHRQHARFALYAYVIMPTHFHVIIKPDSGFNISENLQSLLSYTAHAIMKQLRADGLHDELRYFAEHRQPDRTERHQIWQPAQAKNIFSPEFLREKLEYIHNNPVAKKWRLVTIRADYKYSSACFYDLGQPPSVMVDDVRVWLR